MELLPGGMTLEIFDLDGLPMYNPDVEDQGLPEPVHLLRRAIEAVDGLLIATPEYNYSVSGALKSAIDWASRPPDSPLDGKPLAIMGAGGRHGAMRAQLHLREIALHNSMRVLISPDVEVPQPSEKFDSSLRLTDADTRRRLRNFLAAFAGWIVHSKADPTLRLV